MKRKVFVFAITLSLLLSGILVAIGDETTEGKERKEIQDWPNLQEVWDGLSENYILPDNLIENTHDYDDLLETDNGWNPVGGWDNRFMITSDQNAHEISDLYINRPEASYVGLFRCIDEGAEVADVGVLVGGNGGMVSNSYATGGVNGYPQIGGLIANNEGDVTSSFNQENMPKYEVNGTRNLRINEDEFKSISTFEYAGIYIEMISIDRDYAFFSGEDNEENSTWFIQETEFIHELIIEIKDEGSNDPAQDAYPYYEHEEIVIEPSSEKVYFFKRWKEDQESENEDIKMDENKSITPHFGEEEDEINMMMIVLIAIILITLATIGYLMNKDMIITVIIAIIVIILAIAGYMMKGDGEETNTEMENEEMTMEERYGEEEISEELE